MFLTGGGFDPNFRKNADTAQYGSYVVNILNEKFTELTHKKDQEINWGDYVHKQYKPSEFSKLDPTLRGIPENFKRPDPHFNAETNKRGWHVDYEPMIQTRQSEHDNERGLPPDDPKYIIDHTSMIPLPVLIGDSRYKQNWDEASPSDFTIMSYRPTQTGLGPNHMGYLKQR
jgi:hypothetical protein